MRLDRRQSDQDECSTRQEKGSEMPVRSSVQNEVRQWSWSDWSAAGTTRTRRTNFGASFCGPDGPWSVPSVYEVYGRTRWTTGPAWGVGDRTNYRTGCWSGGRTNQPNRRRTRCTSPLACWRGPPSGAGHLLANFAEYQQARRASPSGAGHVLVRFTMITKLVFLVSRRVAAAAGRRRAARTYTNTMHRS